MVAPAVQFQAMGPSAFLAAWGPWVHLTVRGPQVHFTVSGPNCTSRTQQFGSGARSAGCVLSSLVSLYALAVCRAYFKCARNKDLGCAAKKSMDTRETDSGKVQVLTTSYTGKHNHEEATITTSSHVRSPTLSPLSNRGIPDSTDLAERPQQCTESVEGADILEVEQPQALEDREHGGLGASMPSWEVEDWDVDEWQVDLRLLGGADDRKGQGSGSGLPSDPVTAPAKSEPCEEFLEEDGCSHGQSTRAPTPDPTQLLPKASRIDPSSPFPSLC